jgi:hypothetical protein
MIGLIKKIVAKIRNKYFWYKIEYFHESRKYYPKYMGQYLYKSPINEGGYETTNCVDHAKSSDTEQGARAIIDHCIESGNNYRIIKL